MISIDKDKCVGCGLCVRICPTGSLTIMSGKASFNPVRCNYCLDCLKVCPKEALTYTEDLSLTTASSITKTAKAVKPEVIYVNQPQNPSADNAYIREKHLINTIACQILPVVCDLAINFGEKWLNNKFNTNIANISPRRFGRGKARNRRFGHQGWNK